MRKTHPYAAGYNETLRKRVQQLVDDNPTWDSGQVRTALNGSGAEDFLAYMRLDSLPICWKPAFWAALAKLCCLVSEDAKALAPASSPAKVLAGWEAASAAW